MRHIHYLAALVLLVLLATSVSCTKESCSESETLPEYLYTYDDVGRLHNEGLDYVYNRLLTNREVLTKSPSGVRPDLDNFVESAIIDFVNKKGLDLPAGYPTTKSGISETENLEASMSDLGITYRDSLLSIIGSSKSALEVNCKLSFFKSTVENDSNLLPLDKTSLLCSISTAKSSFSYWQDNYQKWIELYNTSSNCNTKVSCIYGTVKDVEDGQPIGGALLKVKGFEEEVYSEMTGDFCINASEGQTLLVKKYGYHDGEYTILSHLHLDIELQRNNGAWDVINTICSEDVLGAMHGAIAFGAGTAILEGYAAILVPGFGEALLGASLIEGIFESFTAVRPL